MDEQQIRDYQSLPQPESCRLIDFDEVDVITLESFPPQYVLIVSGTKPYLNMEVSLRPRIYIQQPEYWGIEVVGCLPGFGIPVLTPYTVSLRLTGFLGTEGIEVIGATRSEKLEVPPEGKTQVECSNWSAWHGSRPPAPQVLTVLGECKFPTAGYSVELRRHEPQGINPKDLLLDLIVHEPTGPAASVITTLEARYEEKTDFEYETVTILPDGPSISVRSVS